MGNKANNTKRQDSQNKSQKYMESVQSLPADHGENTNESISDNVSKLKQYLKFLYKNNFVSLTYEDLNAYIIQFHWRKFMIKTIKENKKGKVEVIYSSLDRNPNITSRQSRVFQILDTKKYPYKCFDLMKYKSLSSVVDKFGGYDALPAIFINNFYIGSYDKLQELEDLRLVGSLIAMDYLYRCLVCNTLITDDSLDCCPFCYKQYYFFSQNPAKINVYRNRFNEKLEHAN